MDPALFAAGLATMYAAHQVADHVFSQSDKVATNKTRGGRVGLSAMLQHVGNYHVIMYVMLMTTVLVLDLHPSVLGLALCIGFSLLSHAFIDMRWPVKKLLDAIGSPNFAKMITPLNGMYLADQGLHWLCLWISALLLCT